MSSSAAAQEIASDAAGFIGRIPVRNLWLLMLYASELYRTRGDGLLGQEDDLEDLPDLVAEILAQAVADRQRRQLTYGYQSRDAVLNRVRGRIDLFGTERRQLLSRGLVACRFDELTVDTPRNRFVRVALEQIARLVRRPALAHRCRSLAGDLRAMGVSGNPPTRAQMGAERFGRNDTADRFMVAAAKLAFDLALPTEAAGPSAMMQPDREETWVRRLFEKAVGGFYAVALTPHGWRVRTGAPLGWAIEAQTPGIEAILPTMRTDVILEQASTSQRIVIDTKFTTILAGGWYRDATLRSGYLYQIYAYLRSQVNRGDPMADQASGMLLHPSAGDSVDESVVIQGHRIRFATVDLTASATEIRARLLALSNFSEVEGGP